MPAKRFPLLYPIGVAVAGVAIATFSVNRYRLQFSDGTVGCSSGKLFTKTELFFGLSKPNGAIVTSAEFQSFVDAQVTPRFPDGLTLVTGAGQFKSATGAIRREPSKVLVLLHPEGSEQSRAIEQIRTAYRQQFQQESVLRSDDSACVSF